MSDLLSVIQKQENAALLGGYLSICLALGVSWVQSGELLSASAGSCVFGLLAFASFVWFFAVRHAPLLRTG